MDRHEEDTAVLAMFVHGSLAALHLLGVIYNLKRRNWKTACFHISAFAFDLWACYEHWKDVRHDKNNTS